MTKPVREVRVRIDTGPVSTPAEHLLGDLVAAAIRAHEDATC